MDLSRSEMKNEKNSCDKFGSRIYPFDSIDHLWGAERAQMDAEVLEKGYGKGGDFQIFSSVIEGLLLSLILLIVLTTIFRIKKSNKNKSDIKETAGDGLQPPQS